MIPPPEPSRNPSLETLLRLKRSERPDSDFWDEFDRGMKQKQLAAIVEPKPWWLESSLFVRKFAPIAGLGLAGSAALFALVALRLGIAVEPVAGTVALAPGQGAETPSLKPAVVSVASASDPAVVRIAKPSPEQAAVIAPSPAPLRLAAASLGPERVQESKVTRAESISSSRADVGNLLESAVLHVAGLTGPSGFDAHSALQLASTPPADATVSATAEGQFAYSIPALDSLSLAASDTTEAASAAQPDKEVVPFANPRQARLLAMAGDAEAAADSQSLAHVRERVIHRMSDGESLYASISRLGVSGDRLSVRF